jgi:spectrin beta
MSLKRTRQLNDALKFFRLKRDVDEFLAWIDERIRYAQTLSIRSEEAITSSSFNDQVKLFQRQKALNVEIEANSARYTDLNKRCKEEIVANKTLRPVYMRRVADELTRAWQQLAFEAAERAKEFDEAKDLLEFNDQLEQLELWLKDKELMIQNGDTGRDYEHCVSLMKRADEAISPIYEEKLHSVLAMGDKLAHGRTGAELDDLIQKKKRILNR